MDKRKRNKKCSVCGDFAVGYNFGAIACESCKAFFRRSAHKAQKTSCLFNERCSIEVATRRFCSHCRLKKCLNVGMKPSLILDENAKHERREKITRNRLTRSNATVNKPTHSSASVVLPPLPHPPPQPSLPSTTPSSTHLEPNSVVGSNSFLLSNPDPTALEAGTESSHSISEALDRVLSPSASCTRLPLYEPSSIDPWRSFFDGPSDGLSQVADSSEQLYCRGSLSTTSPYSHNSTEFSTDPSSVTPPNCISYIPPVLKTCCSAHSHGAFSTGLPKDDMSRLLSHYQWTAIHDLRHAYETNFVEEESCSNLKRSDLTLSGLINTSRFLVRRLINFAKTLTDFSQLKQDCQINLLKGVVLSTLFLLSARHYDVEKDVWLTPKGEVSTQILKVATGMSNFYEEHTRYCRDFNALVAQDSNLVALMQTLCLFTPDRPSLDARQAVANVHDRYYLLLKHYLEAKAGFTRGRALLTAVLSNLGQLETLTMNYGHMLMRLDPTKVDPLLMEIFNLTPSDSSTAHHRPMV